MIMHEGYVDIFVKWRKFVCRKASPRFFKRTLHPVQNVQYNIKSSLVSFSSIIFVIENETSSYYSLTSNIIYYIILFVIYYTVFMKRHIIHVICLTHLIWTDKISLMSSKNINYLTFARERHKYWKLIKLEAPSYVFSSACYKMK